MADTIVTTLTLREWVNPALQARGIRADGIYTAVVWGGIIGPSATALLRLIPQLTSDEQTTSITIDELALTIGVSASVGTRSIDRLIHFGFASLQGSTLEVRHYVDLVAQGRLAKLSPLACRLDLTYRQFIRPNQSI